MTGFIGATPFNSMKLYLILNLLLPYLKKIDLKQYKKIKYVLNLSK